MSPSVLLPCDQSMTGKCSGGSWRLASTDSSPLFCRLAVPLLLSWEHSRCLYVIVSRVLLMG
jgi:hypothetical protein